MDNEKAEGRRAQERTQPTRLGGARADFVASLGRKVNDARAVLAVIEAERGTPGERGPREELRRRLHAIGASARLLRFDQMARTLADAEATIDRAALEGRVTEADLAALAQVLDDLPALAWGEPTPRERQASEPPAEVAMPRTALVVGAEMLAEALTDDHDLVGGRFFECERTDDAQAAVGLARTIAPDVILIDADVDSAIELVEALLDDPLTEPVPIVVVGAFRAPEQASRFIALGVARALTKPVTVESLHRACSEAIDQHVGMTMRVTLGEPTLEQLGERLAEEVRRALVESVDTTARGVRVPLGEGTEVLGAVWGAIARVREVVTTRTGGAVRFSSTGPEGAIAVAPWLHPDMPGTDRVASGSARRTRGPAADVRLEGRRVIVADDDPGVTWFIADLLRTAGCSVYEALDGSTALDLCYRVSPELVVSDILMPGLDGFGLARGLKRDVALRDTAVILLSWKEDLLQRVRELGASAAAYMRKESDSRAIVARVRECLRPRARVEARLRGEGEVRGRLDDLTVRSLLDLVCQIRPNSRASVRDASFLYEVEIRDGAPRALTRTAGDGSFMRGERVLPALLGVGAGRFTVATSTAPIANHARDLAGSLASQIARPLAMARAAMNATTGARTMSVEHLTIDDEALASYLMATPEGARLLVLKLARGASPRAMLLNGEVDPTLLEDVLLDLASRGAIVGAKSHTGADLFEPAVETLLAAQEAPVRPSRSKPPPSVQLPEDEEELAAEGELLFARTEGAVDLVDLPFPEPRPVVPEPVADDGTASSLADAVMRELSERSPEIRTRSSHPPPIVEPSELRPRSSTPPAGPVREQVAMPPDAIVPGAPTLDLVPGPREIEAEAQPSAPPDLTPVLDFELLQEEELPSEELEEDDTYDDPIEVDETELDAPVAPVDESRTIETPEVEPVPIEIERVASVAPITVETQGDARTPFSVSTASKRPRSRPSRWPYFAGIALTGSLTAIALMMTGSAPDPVGFGASAPLEAVTTLPAVVSASTVTTSGAAMTTETAEIPAGQGLVEVTLASEAPVRIDGIVRGTGPKLRVALTPGQHEVQVKLDAHGTPRARTIEVRAGQTARVDLVSSP